MDNMFQKIGNSQNIIFLIGIIIYGICLFTITDIALMLFVTYVIACALNPLVDKLEKKCSRNINNIPPTNPPNTIAVAIFLLHFFSNLSTKGFNAQAIT